MLELYLYDYCSQVCAEWSEWGDWSVCSVTCGYGLRTHFRTCNGGRPGDRGCEGSDDEESLCFGSVRYLFISNTYFDLINSLLCSPKICPHLSEWTHWTECSKECGDGVTTRTRICINGGSNDPECDSDLEQTASCNSNVR